MCVPHLFWMGFQPDLGTLRRPKLAVDCLKGVIRPSTLICCCCACSAFCRLVDGRDTSSRRAPSFSAATLVSSAAGHELSRRSATSSATVQQEEELDITCRLDERHYRSLVTSMQKRAWWWCVCCSSWDSVRGSGWCVD